MTPVHDCPRRREVGMGKANYQEKSDSSNFSHGNEAKQPPFRLDCRQHKTVVTSFNSRDLAQQHGRSHISGQRYWSRLRRAD